MENSRGEKSILERDDPPPTAPKLKCKATGPSHTAVELTAKTPRPPWAEAGLPPYYLAAHIPYKKL